MRTRFGRTGAVLGSPSLVGSEGAAGRAGVVDIGCRSGSSSPGTGTLEGVTASGRAGGVVAPVGVGPSDIAPSSLQLLDPFSLSGLVAGGAAWKSGGTLGKVVEDVLPDGPGVAEVGSSGCAKSISGSS